MSGWKFALIWVAAGLVIASIVVALPPQFNQTRLVGADVGLVQVTLSALTFAAAVGSLYFLFRRSRHDDKLLENSNRQDRLKQLQSAADLLASDSETANTAGIGIITSLIVNFAEEFGRLGLNVLTAYISEKTRKEWDTHSEVVNKAYGNPPPSSFGRTTRAVVRAIVELNTIRKAFGSWPGRLPNYPQLIVERACLGFVNFADLDLSEIDFSNLIAHKLTFLRCKLIGAELHIIADHHLKFTNCDLTDATLLVADMGQKEFPSSGFLPELSFVDCTLQGATINGKPILAGTYPGAAR